MPTRKKDMLEAYVKWNKRACPVFYEPNDVVLREEENDRVEDIDVNDVAELTNVDSDVLETMMTLGAVTHVWREALWDAFEFFSIMLKLSTYDVRVS